MPGVPFSMETEFSIVDCYFGQPLFIYLFHLQLLYRDTVLTYTLSLYFYGN